MASRAPATAVALLLVAVAALLASPPAAATSADTEKAIEFLRRNSAHCGTKAEKIQGLLAPLETLQQRRFRPRPTLWDLMETEAFGEALLSLDLECVVRSSGSRAAFQAFLDRAVSPQINDEGVAGLLSNASEALHEFYSGGCNTEQLLGFLPSLSKMGADLKRDGRYVQESALLFDLYQSSYDYKGTTVGYTQETIDGSPAISVCLSSSLKVRA